MNLQDYQFNLPQSLIAQEPVSPRDAARLLVYDRSSKQITDAIFSEIDNYLAPQTTLVLNNTKVEHCRILFNDCELFILQQIDPNVAIALVRPGKRFALHETVPVNDELEVTVTAINDEGHRMIKANIPFDNDRWNEYRHVPLPPYIKQNDALADEYQTVFARATGSKAAPTAGLHFTKQLLSELSDKHDIVEVELQVGLGTFAKVSQKNIEENSLHEEQYIISAEAAKMLNTAPHITAVGTTSLRTLEAAKTHGSFDAQTAKTDIFIHPGYEFKAVDSLITNFHLPGSSLLMLVAAMTGLDEMHRIYQHAIESEYRFYSFGDAMLIV